MSDGCPVCGDANAELDANPTSGDYTKFHCPRCGSFMLSGRLIKVLPSLKSRERDVDSKLSHFIRKAHERGESLHVTTHMAEAVAKQPLPRPREQADLLIRWLAKNIPGLGETLPITFSTHGSVVGSRSREGFKMLVDHLFESGLVAGIQSKTFQTGDNVTATLTFAGWEHYENLREGSPVYRRAFMAMKFGNEQLNSVLESVFKPNAKRAGFDLKKLDDEPKAGLIDDRLRVEIQSSDFLIADLTHDNLGAYWEAGYAEGLGKPVIYTCEKQKFSETKTHFDTNHHLTIVWDATAPERSGDELTATIRATLPHLAYLSDEDV